MDAVAERLIAEAFGLSRARGPDLLVRLGDFDVWRGDLAEMRRDGGQDSSLAAAAVEGDPHKRLSHTLVMARAVELLDARCREKLAAAYQEGSAGTEPGATHSSDPAVLACRKRLMQIF